MTPPPGRPVPGPVDPAQRLPQLKLQRATLAAQLPTDDEFDALLSAQADAQRANRQAQKDALVSLDEQIAAAEETPASA